MPAWQAPREAHAVDFGAYAGLSGEVEMEELGTEEDFLEAIREDVNESMDNDELSQDEVWSAKCAAGAQSYLWDVVYGGVDGLAYIRSLAEFVSPPIISVCTL
jgi:bromodomain-containing protein 7